METFMSVLRVWVKISLCIGILIGLLLSACAYLSNLPPSDFPIERDFLVREGMTVRAIGISLYEEGYIKSPFLFRLLIRGAYDQVVIQAGGYRFSERMTTVEIIEALAAGESLSPNIVLTFPEGFSVYDIEEYTNHTFGSISLERLIPHEGYLFPDTYFVSTTETIDDLIARMRNEYVEQIAPYREQILASGMSERDIITLASILEREANDETSMRMVSGILRRRLEENLPLQVDATFEYILGKTSAELTIEDLNINSPYNTYLYTDLPPTPIANPGVLAIDAALNPTPSDFYYYLTGDDGVFYYARTFEEHKLNKEKYIDSI